MKKEQLQEIIIKISKMDKSALINYSQKVYLSKADIDKKAFKFIERALDIQIMNLRDETTLSPLAVCSELREGEL